ncbi:MAG: hypothetical protein PHU23_15060 [Dehalococcoidales bacterium]|nr:hypothetical protein [Dehalococcoidales bacterium]
MSRTKLARIIIHSFLIVTIAYLLVAVALVLYFIAQTGWSRLDNDIFISLISGLTLGLSELTWWGNLWYLAVMVPWLGSLLLMVLLSSRFNNKAKQSRLFSGLAVFAYYFVMWLILIGQAILQGGGDANYFALVLWLVAGFALGYISAMIGEKFPPKLIY